MVVRHPAQHFPSLVDNPLAQRQRSAVQLVGNGQCHLTHCRPIGDRVAHIAEIQQQSLFQGGKFLFLRAAVNFYTQKGLVVIAFL